MDKLTKLEKLLKETDTKQEFNIVEDLKSLALTYGLIKPKVFRKKLDALIEKYECHELTAIREALLKKCQQGDVQAIRLYSEHFKHDTKIVVDDGLIEALAGAGKEAFADEV